ncbi:MAG: hypothetical protein ACRDJE_29080, partial [Dehalococcoidia bacterium]
PLTLAGRVAGGSFIPDQPVRITEEEERQFIALLAEEGHAVERIAQPEGQNPVQMAAKALGTGFGVARDVYRRAENVTPLRALDFVTGGDTTLVEQVLRPLTWLGDQGAQLAMQGLIRLPDRILPAEDRELKAAMLSLSRGRQNELIPAWAGTLADPEAKRELANDIRSGYTDTDLNQKYSNFWKELGFRATADPLNLVVPLVAVTRAATGLERASGAIGARNRLANNAIRDALAPVSDAEAVAPWDRVRRAGSPRALVGESAGVPGAQRREILGTQSQAARASSANIVGGEIAGLMEARAAQNIDDLEPLIRTLATEGADAAGRQYFQGIGATRVLQDARFVAPDVVTVLDTPGSSLRTALDKPVYQGPGSFHNLPAKEQAKFYASDAEKLADVTDELQGTIRRSARTHFGLDPERDAFIVRAQVAMKGVMSNIYLLNPRYYIRNALGDEVVARTFGLSTFGKTADRESFLRNVLADTTTRVPASVSGEVGAAGRGIIPGAKRIRQSLSNMENERGRTVYAKQAEATWNARRAATWEDGFDAIADIPGADRIRDGVKSAKSPRDIDRLIICESPCRIDAPMRASR